MNDQRPWICPKCRMETYGEACIHCGAGKADTKDEASETEKIVHLKADGVTYLEVRYKKNGKDRKLFTIGGKFVSEKKFFEELDIISNV